MIAKKHPVANWLQLSPNDYRSALDQVLRFRDQDPDPNASGLPAAAVDWFWNQELPQLMQRPEVRVFAEERVSELNAKAADLRQRIERQVGSMEAEAAEAQSEADRIASLLREVQP